MLPRVEGPTGAPRAHKLIGMSGSPRSVLQEPGDPGLRAVVLGAGLAGLVSAACACKHFHVTLIDADSLGPALDAEQVGLFAAAVGTAAATRGAAGAGTRQAAPDHLLPAALPRQAAKRRKGVPQMLHPHTLVTGGLQAIEAVLPGFKAEVGGVGRRATA